MNRDLAGELKDIWLAVQAKRERDKDISNSPVPYGSPEFSHTSPVALTYVEFGPEAPYPPVPPPQPLPATEGFVYEPVPYIEEFIGNWNNIPTKPTTIESNSDTGLKKSTDEATVSLNDLKMNKEQLPTNQRLVVVVNQNEIDNKIKNNENLESLEKNIDVVSVTPIENPLPIMVPVVLPQTANHPPLVPEQNQTTPVSTPPTSTKKEKLGGFLPNGCHNIFPFIKSKNSQTKKDKKHKEIKIAPLKDDAVTMLANGGGGGGGSIDANRKMLSSPPVTPTGTPKAATKHNLIVNNVHVDCVSLDFGKKLRDDGCSDGMQKLKL